MVLRVDYVITPERTQEILQAFGLQLVKEPADSKASGQQGHESSVPQRREEEKSSVPRFQNIPIATLDVIPYIFHCCGDPVCRLSYRRA